MVEVIESSLDSEYSSKQYATRLRFQLEYIGVASGVQIIVNRSVCKIPPFRMRFVAHNVRFKHVLIRIKEAGRPATRPR